MYSQERAEELVADGKLRPNLVVTQFEMGYQRIQ